MIRPQVKHALLPLLCELLSAQEGYMLANYLLLKLGMKANTFFHGEASQEVLDLVLDAMQSDSDMFVPVNEARPRYDDRIGATARDRDGMLMMHTRNLEAMAHMHGNEVAAAVTPAEPPVHTPTRDDPFNPVALGHLPPTRVTTNTGRIPQLRRNFTADDLQRLAAERLREWQETAITTNNAVIQGRPDPLMWVDEGVQVLTREEETARAREVLERFRGGNT